MTRSSEELLGTVHHLSEPVLEPEPEHIVSLKLEDTEEVRSLLTSDLSNFEVMNKIIEIIRQHKLNDTEL